MEILEKLSCSLQEGETDEVIAFVKEALDQGIEAKVILDEGLVKGMQVIGEEFAAGTAFIPEVLISADAMNSGIRILEPYLIGEGGVSAGRVVIGTIKGDLHDIGKNIVVTMLKSAGFEVFDLGVDVAPKALVDKAEEVGADIIGISTLLTTTMGKMADVISDLNERGIRDKYTVMIGGAPVSQAFADKIGADYYTVDALEAAKKALDIMTCGRAQ